MTILRNSTDSRVLGWGALTIAVLVMAAFLGGARPHTASISAPAGVTYGHATTSVSGHGHG